MFSKITGFYTKQGRITLLCIINIEEVNYG